MGYIVVYVGFLSEEQYKNKVNHQSIDSINEDAHFITQILSYNT